MAVAECSLVVTSCEHLGIKHQLEMAFVFRGSQGLATFRIQQVHRQATWLKSKGQGLCEGVGKAHGARPAHSWWECPQTTLFRIVSNHARTIFCRGLLMAWRYSETLKETLCASFSPAPTPLCPEDNIQGLQRPCYRSGMVILNRNRLK